MNRAPHGGNNTPLTDIEMERVVDRLKVLEAENGSIDRGDIQNEAAEIRLQRSINVMKQGTISPEDVNRLQVRKEIVI